MSNLKQPLELKLTPVFDEDRPTMPNGTVSCAYIVHDQHLRKVGWLLRANYMGSKKEEWYAITPDGGCSVWLLTTRRDALETLEVMYRGYLATTHGIEVRLPDLKTKG